MQRAHVSHTFSEVCMLGSGSVLLRVWGAMREDESATRTVIFGITGVDGVADEL